MLSEWLVSFRACTARHICVSRHGLKAVGRSPLLLHLCCGVSGFTLAAMQVRSWFDVGVCIHVVHSAVFGLACLLLGTVCYVFAWNGSCGDI